MRIDILTLFPKMFQGPFKESIIQRARDKSLVEIQIHDLRSWATDKHRTVDDRPYGGGVGMLLMVEPVDAALKKLRQKKTRIILLDAAGEKFSQKKASDLSRLDHIIFIAGHYEGVDERIKEHLVDEEISIGDYILTGGELPAMVVVDAVVRLIPGVLEKPEATQYESFSNLPTSHLSHPTLEYPQYTRPENFQGWGVPKVLLGGNHKEIDKWRLKRAIERTKKLRPDLLQ